MSQETNIGSGWWQYDYTISNTSDTGESLYMFLLDFEQTVTVEGSTLPTAWFGVVWEGTNDTTFVDAMSFNPATYVSAGDSLAGFSFRADTQLGNLSYHAEFINTSSIDGITSNSASPVAPEPVSTVLFLTGGVIMAFRYRQKSQRQLT